MCVCVRVCVGGGCVRAWMDVIVCVWAWVCVGACGWVWVGARARACACPCACVWGWVPFDSQDRRGIGGETHHVKLDPGYPESVCDKGDARML